MNYNPDNDCYADYTAAAERALSEQPVTSDDCPHCGAPRGSDHGILCPSPRSDTPDRTSEATPLGSQTPPVFKRNAMGGLEDHPPECTCGPCERARAFDAKPFVFGERVEAPEYARPGKVAIVRGYDEHGMVLLSWTDRLHVPVNYWPCHLRRVSETDPTESSMKRAERWLEGSHGPHQGWTTTMQRALAEQFDEVAGQRRPTATATPTPATPDFARARIAMRRAFDAVTREDALRDLDVAAMYLGRERATPDESAKAPRVPKHPHDPPFDDGAPCPMCPRELRNLAAVAHNTVSAWRTGRHHKMPERLAELERAVEAVKPYSEAHFADRMHSHGEKNR